MGDITGEGTRVIYHLEDQETPYLIRINVAPQHVTLGDFKQVLNKSNLKFYFKSEDADFGVVKEEISDDDAKLPCVNGRVVCWVVSSDASQTDVQSLSTSTSLAPLPTQRTGGIGHSRPPSFHAVTVSSHDEPQGSEVKPTEKIERDCGQHLNGHAHQDADRNGAGPTGGGESPSALQSSELETTSFYSSEDSGGRLNFYVIYLHLCVQPINRAKQLVTSTREASVSSSPETEGAADGAERYNFLGISIVGQSNDRGDGGIYIGSIMKGGAVAADGRIEPGDMLLQVNDINFENMSNDDAVRVLREIIHKPGPVTLTVAKCWDPNPRGCFTLPRSEPVRPIDPAAWVSHTAAMTGRLLPHYGVHEENNLTTHTDMTAVVKAMTNPESGLEVRDRMWLKITIPNAFIGSDVVDWLHQNVEGFTDRREARKYAGNLLKAGFIRHTVNKVTFSEQCYYVFGDVCGDLGLMSLLDHEGASSRTPQSEGDPLGPDSGFQWTPAFPYQYPIPHPYSLPYPLHHLQTWGEGGAGGGGEGGGGGSQRSEGSCSSGSDCSDGQKEKGEGGCSESVLITQLTAEPPVSLSEPLGDDSVDPLPSLHAASPSIPPEDLSGSRQSFRLAMGNPSDFFVDVM
ncbi:segment polarity protein dishevelled homolog DVL-3-like isoform X2 [Betta splendens]|uniref:Segment polarity protein dishevelled homolog DVL-3-like isoform X2 n=1 Tax=Betta splendens TaxID=158456 RepID=A0A6P7P6P3_BETSP|nr:segment polarity protein dishevelled homolog DVL-3-like isoform X2 [Betta splendens]